MIEQLTPPIRGIIMDMDGVLWRGNQPLGNLQEIFQTIQAFRWKVMLLTNNATRPPEYLQERLAKYGVEVDIDQIVNSAMAVAYLMKKKFPEGGPVYAVGEEGLHQALRARNFYQAEKDVLAVVAGLDRTITYEKLRTATLLIRKGAPFYGTNPDLTYPDPEGLVPGAGTILAALQAASGTEPVIAGKPMPGLFQLALERMGTLPEETLMVGDRLDTDILGGQRAGLRTAVVLTGVSTSDEVEQWTPPPDLVASSLSDLIAEQVSL